MSPPWRMRSACARASTQSCGSARVPRGRCVSEITATRERIRRSMAVRRTADTRAVDHRPLPRVVWFVWALLGLVALAVFATYARLPATELFHVSRRGAGGG